MEEEEDEEKEQPQQQQQQQQQQEEPAPSAAQDDDATATATQEQQEQEQEEGATTTKKFALLQGLHVRRLLRRFLGDDPLALAARRDEWQHVASVLHNVSQLQVG